MISLGLGLIGIGKPWGHAGGEVPGERGARELLAAALELGIRHFDTAASYGVSEERVGRFLAELTAGERERLVVATKFREHWDAERQEPFVDHGYDALCRSLDVSLARLGGIDLLQLHKATPEVLRSDALHRAIEYAKAAGVPAWGASASDLESAALSVGDPDQTWMQVPYNMASPRFAGAIDAAAARGMRIAANRPFAMGAMLYGETPVDREAAFRFVLARGFDGVVLTGTKSVAHLRENVEAFRRANLGHTS